MIIKDKIPSITLLASKNTEASESTHYGDITCALASDVNITFQIIPKSTTIKGIRLRIGTYDRINHCHITIKIADNLHIFDARSLKNNDFNDLYFDEPQMCAPEIPLTLELYSEDANENNMVALWCSQALPLFINELDYSPLHFPYSPQPRVSIVIPIFNKALYTYNCLLTVKNCDVDVTKEVIIVNNASIDESAALLTQMRGGITVIRNAENTGFVQACRRGADMAKGDFILFLNNDTQVTEGWLSTLLKIMDKYSNVGITGSKLIYPNGKLQEAGGIIFNDASGWNYGRMQDPTDPRFNKNRLVDYCSGASLMIRKSLWQKIGGFDLRYAPAYYEDTDLCFAARQAGFQVMYCADSRVIHHEGITAGTDISSGYKAFQAINHKKFLTKWANVLKTHYPPPPAITPEQASERLMILRRQQYQQYIDRFTPQLGEMTWHSLTVDSSIDEMSQLHLHSLLSAMDKYFSHSLQRPIRFLEIAAYAHYTGQLLTQKLDIDVTLFDISPKTLKFGQKLASAQGIEKQATLVSGDFHDLPFHEGFFDVVFIASAIHHTRRPERVLTECLRVLAQDGLFIMENEPCTRLFSFYKFSSNREDSFTPFEKHLAKKGLLRTISSPFYGSRPEELFGMIENAHIPLSLYTDTVLADAEIVEKFVNYGICMGEFENAILAEISSNHAELAQFIQQKLHTEFEEARALLGQREQLLGFSLPDEGEISTLSEQVAVALKHLPDESHSDERTFALANIFGAALRMIVKKKSVTHQIAPTCFSKPMIQQDQVWREKSSDQDIKLDISNTLLPDIQDNSPEKLFEYFLKEEWVFCQEGHGISAMLNGKANSRVKMPNAVDTAVLLIRLYVVEKQDEPYRISIFYGDTQITEISVCQSETRLVRVFIENSENFLTFKIHTIDGKLIELPHHLRISIMQIIPLILL